MALELGTFLVRQYRSNAIRHRRMLDGVTADLTGDELNWQFAPGHHSIWHHVWHMFLSNDYYFAGAMQLPAVWEAGNGRDAARHLGISRHTLRTHLQNARSRLGARTTLEAIRLTLG